MLPRKNDPAAGVKAVFSRYIGKMDSVSVALLESAYREYEDKQRLNLEVLKTMIQAVCRRVGDAGSSRPAEVKSDVSNVNERLAKLEEMIQRQSEIFTKIHDSHGRIVPKTPVLAAIALPPPVEEVKHIHLEAKVKNEMAIPMARSVAPVMPVVEEVKHIHLTDTAPIEETVVEEEEVVVSEAVEEEEVIVDEDEAVEEEEAAEEEEGEELELEEFEWKGKTYYKDGDNNVYDLNDEGEPEKIGQLQNGKIMLD